MNRQKALLDKLRELSRDAMIMSRGFDDLHSDIVKYPGFTTADIKRHLKDLRHKRILLAVEMSTISMKPLLD